MYQRGQAVESPQYGQGLIVKVYLDSKGVEQVLALFKVEGRVQAQRLNVRHSQLSRPSESTPELVDLVYQWCENNVRFSDRSPRDTDLLSWFRFDSDVEETMFLALRGRGLLVLPNGLCRLERFDRIYRPDLLVCNSTGTWGILEIDDKSHEGREKEDDLRDMHFLYYGIGTYRISDFKCRANSADAADKFVEWLSSR